MMFTTSLLAAALTLTSLTTASPSPALVSEAELEKRIICAEASRFGIASITPNTGLKTGDKIHIKANFACSFYFGIDPVYTTYEALVGPSADYELAVYVAARKPDVSAAQPWDNFTVTIPDAYWTAGETYGITLWTFYEDDGPTGGSFLTQGGVGTAGLTFANTTSS